MTQPLFAVVFINNEDEGHFLWDAGHGDYTERPSMAKLHNAAEAFRRRQLIADAYGEERAVVVSRETRDAAEIALQHYASIIKTGKETL